MKKGNLIFIVGGLGLLYYYFMRKKTNPIPVTTLMPSTPEVESTTNIAVEYKYPAGLQELDYVANGVESAQLYQGMLRPMTAAYAQRYAPNSWPITKIIPNVIYQSIPRGPVLDV